MIVFLLPGLPTPGLAQEDLATVTGRIGRETVTYGGDWSRTNPRTGGTIHGQFERDDEIVEYGGYVQSRTRIFEPLQLIATLRLDESNVIEDPVLSPRVGFVFQPEQGGVGIFEAQEAIDPGTAGFLRILDPTGSVTVNAFDPVTEDLQALTPDAVEDVSPLLENTTSTFEVGYRGMLGGKVFLQRSLAHGEGELRIPTVDPYSPSDPRRSRDVGVPHRQRAAGRSGASAGRGHGAHPSGCPLVRGRGGVGTTRNAAEPRSRLLPTPPRARIVLGPCRGNRKLS